MKYIAYIKICMLLILLLSANVVVSAQAIDTTTKESGDSTYQKISDSPAKAVLEQHADSMLKAIQTRACVNVFTNQTVSSIMSVLGCSTLTVQNVTVVNGGNLSLTAPGEITVNGTFDVLLGGVLNVGGIVAPPQLMFNYGYDASGNRISRSLTTTMAAETDESTTNHVIEEIEAREKAGFEE